MTQDRFRTLIDGTLAMWQADAQTRFDAAATRCRILRGVQTLAVLGYEETAIGGVWRIEAAGRTARTHQSIVPALAGLREAVCPQRPHGRMLFAPHAAHDVTHAP